MATNEPYLNLFFSPRRNVYKSGRPCKMLVRLVFLRWTNVPSGRGGNAPTHFMMGFLWWTSFLYRGGVVMLLVPLCWVSCDGTASNLRAVVMLLLVGACQCSGGSMALKLHEDRSFFSRIAQTAPSTNCLMIFWKTNLVKRACFSINCYSLDGKLTFVSCGNIWIPQK